MLEFLDGFRCVTGCHSFHRIFGSIFHPQADPGKRWSLLARHTSRLVSFVDYPSQVNDGATAAPQRRAATRLLCNCQDTGTLTPQWPPCACDLQSTTIACVSVFSASGTARARSFSTHERSRTTASTVSVHIDHKDRRQLQLFQRLALRRGRASFCNICQHTSSRPPVAGLLVTPWNKDDMGDGVPTDQLSHNHCDCTDSHCNSHIVTSCVFVLVLHSHHKSIGGRLLLTSSSCSRWASLVSSVKTRHISWSSLSG